MDDFNEAIPAWDLHFQQKSPGKLSSRVDVMHSDELLLSRISMNQQVYQQGAAPAGMMTFGILCANSPALQWCGYEISDRTLEQFAAGSQFECASDSGFDVTTISVDAGQLGYLADCTGLKTPVFMGAGRFTPGKSLLRAIRQLTNEIFRHTSTQCALTGRATILSALYQELIMHLLEASTAPLPGSERSSRRSRRQVRMAAIDYMHEHAQSSLSIGELCKQVGTSWRQLDYAFKDHFGVTPKTYLSMLRLDGLRQNLLNAEPGTTVTRIASCRGFTHFGQLALDYKKLFGESPSETLRHHLTAH